MARKTKLMKSVEARYGYEDLETLLPRMINEQGLTATAGDLGVSKATLGYWLLKLSITVKRIALRPGETIEIRRTYRG